MKHSLTDLRDVIKTGLRNIDFFKPPRELYEPIQYTLELGGKRLRPALCLLACELFGEDIKKAINAAIGIEIFHNFTLVHDDIMDRAPIRRGKETVYKKWNPNIAILSGDTMMAISYDYIMKSPEKVRSEVFSIFNKTAIQVCEGQQFDMNFELQKEVSIESYIDMIRLKTAVLLAGSLKIGAVIGGASISDAEKLYSFGENIGIAFQLNDDLLDAFSDEEKFGKKKGGDIVANKKTFLYLKALQLADTKKAKELKSLFSELQIDTAVKINKVLGYYNQLNIEEITKAEIDRYYQKGMAYLDEIDLPDERKSELRAFADQLKKRDY